MNDFGVPSCEMLPFATLTPPLIPSGYCLAVLPDYFDKKARNKTQNAPKQARENIVHCQKARKMDEKARNGKICLF